MTRFHPRLPEASCRPLILSNSRISISRALGMVFLLLTLPLIGTLGGMLWSAIQSEQNAERIAALSALDRVAFETASAVRVVRAKMLAANAAGVVSHSEYEAIRQDADRLVIPAISRLDPAVVPGGLERIEGLRQAWAEIDWAGLEELEAKPSSERRQLVDQWFRDATKMVDRLSDLSKTVVGRIRTVDVRVAALMPVRQLAWALRETSGNECLLMRPVIVMGEKPPQHIQAKLDQLRGQTDAIWGRLDEVTSQEGFPARLNGAVKNAKIASEESNLARDRVYARLGLGDAPLSAAEWNKICLTPFDTIMQAAAVTNDLVELHARTQQVQLYWTVWTLTAFAFGAVGLVVVAIAIVRRAVVLPLSEITRVIGAVAAGTADVTVPHGHRHDEIGALARSISVFQDAMLRNVELNRTVSDEAAARARRQEEVAAEIARFSAEIEKTVADLADSSEQMLGASAHLTEVADSASKRTAGATAASNEASSNVRAIASAAEELSASVTEINRQVSQSNVVAEKAVGEAERTNAEMKALDEAASCIGDVVKLVTDIAEQTNLLALNATIEAARAGDAGRGFAVVASEVKALAGQTAEATEEISTQISGMQQATIRSVAAIATIQRTIHELGEITATVANAVARQGNATDEIARSTEIASTHTAETAGEVSRVSEATDDTRKEAAAVKAVADKLGTVAHSIRDQVEGFFRKLKAA